MWDDGAVGAVGDEREVSLGGAAGSLCSACTVQAAQEFSRTLKLRRSESVLGSAEDYGLSKDAISNRNGKG